MSTQALLTGVELKAWSNFLRAHAAIRRELDRALATQHGLTISDFEVLYRLAKAPDKMLRRVDLAQNVLLTPSGITRLLDGLENSGFVKKKSCKTDARVVYAKLTEKGQKRLDSASKDHLASVRDLFRERFSNDELELFASMLERLPQTPSDGC